MSLVLLCKCNVLTSIANHTNSHLGILAHTEDITIGILHSVSLSPNSCATVNVLKRSANI